MIIRRCDWTVQRHLPSPCPVGTGVGGGCQGGKNLICDVKWEK